jgi:hypothetical protein
MNEITAVDDTKFFSQFKLDQTTWQGSIRLKGFSEEEAGQHGGKIYNVNIAFKNSEGALLIVSNFTISIIGNLRIFRPHDRAHSGNQV